MSCVRAVRSLQSDRPSFDGGRTLLQVRTLLASKASAAALVTAALVAFLAPQSAAATTTRYASPTGSGNTCSQAAPCDVKTALEGAASGNHVDIRGDQGDYAIGSPILAKDHIVVVGSHGRPRLILSNGYLQFNASTLQNLYVQSPAPDRAAFALYSGSTADRVLVKNGGTGHACYLESSTLTNSVCWAGSSADLAIETDGSNTLRNVTAYGGSRAAILVFARNECACLTAKLTMVNVIARAATGGNDLELNSDGSSTVRVKPTYSNYVTTLLAGPGALTKTVIVTSGTNQTSASTRPKFVNAAAGNFREKASSPTVNAGTNAAANGTQDLYGDARIQNGRTDIGATEF